MSHSLREFGGKLLDHAGKGLGGATASRRAARQSKRIALATAAGDAVDALVMCEPLETRVLLSVPAATNLTASVNSSNYVNVSWTSPDDTATNAPGFELYGSSIHSTGPDPTAGDWHFSFAHTNTSATNIGDGVDIVEGDYFFRVRTYDLDPDTGTYGYAYAYYDVTGETPTYITVPPHFSFFNGAGGPVGGGETTFEAVAGQADVNQPLADSDWETGSPVVPMTGVINWGDGKSSDATFDYSDGLTVEGTHTYAQPGLYTYSLTVFHNGTTATFSDTAWVLPAAPVAAPPCNCGTVVGTGTGDSNSPTLSPDEVNGVRLFDGTMTNTTDDLDGSGFDGLGLATVYSSVSDLIPAGNAGNNTVISQDPSLIQPYGAGNGFAVTGDGMDTRFFSVSGGSLSETSSLGDSLVENEDGSYTFTDSQGDTTTFNGFSESLPVMEQGSFESYTDGAGNTVNVTSYTSNGDIGEVQSVTGSGGSAVTDSYLYTYLADGDNAGSLASVVLRSKVGDGSWSNIQEADFTYYDSSGAGANAYGNQGDLQTATIKDGAGNVTDTY